MGLITLQEEADDDIESARESELLRGYDHLRVSSPLLLAAVGIYGLTSYSLFRSERRNSAFAWRSGRNAATSSGW